MTSKMEHFSSAESDDAMRIQIERASATLSALLQGHPVDAPATRALSKICAAPYAIVVAKRHSGKSQADAQDINDFAKAIAPHYVVAVHDGVAVALMSHADAGKIVTSAFDKGRLSKLSVAYSLPFSSMQSIPQQFKLLEYCLETSDDDRPKNAQEQALRFLLADIASNVDFESLVHPAIGILAHYDETNQSNLLETLNVYLENDRNAQRCANALYLHRNSLQYRVRRIQEIAGIDLDDPNERAYLRLSFLLLSA